MTTKRKTILATLAKSGPTILDDLVDATGWVRKNLQDNLKACVDEGLVDKLKDNVTGLPAYKVSTKGQQWLKNSANSSVTTQAGSGDITPAVAHCASSLASASPGKGATVTEPPTPEHSPAAVRSDDSALSKSVTEFCEWVGKQAGVRVPRNLRECKAVIDALKSDGDALTTELEQANKIKQLQADLDAKATELNTANRINNELVEQLLTPIDPKPARYIITDTYLLADTDDQACEIALEIA